MLCLNCLHNLCSEILSKTTPSLQDKLPLLKCFCVSVVIVPFINALLQISSKLEVIFIAFWYITPE